jgi:sec-independent protein translocase protein TatB
MSAPNFWEIIMLAVLALLIFGPDRLPGVARDVGRMIGQFRRQAAGTLDELKASADFDEFRDLKGVADEFRGLNADLRRSVSLTGPLASGARPTTPAKPTVTAEGPPPFDPDAT